MINIKFYKMKKLILFLSAAFLVVASFAFSTGKATPKSFDPVLHWFTTSGAFTGRTDTKINEIPESGCPNEGMVPCEYGYSDADLNVPGNPSLGLKTTATVDDIIVKEE